MTKQCRCCKQKYPQTSEYFHSKASRPDGLRDWCKTCVRADNNERHKKTIEDDLTFYAGGNGHISHDNVHLFVDGKGELTWFSQLRDLSYE